MASKEKLLASAQKNLQKGLVAKAIKDYQQVVELDPKDIRNRQKLAELYCRAKLSTEALTEYGAVAKYYADNGFYLKAIAVFKQMQKLDPEQVSIYHRLAELNVKQGLVGNAQAEYRTLVTFFEKKKLLSDAIGVLEKMAELEPDNLNIHIKIAECYVQAGFRDKAREEFKQVLGRLREDLQFERMVKLYEICQPIFPDDPELLTGLAEALIRKGEAGQGLKLLKGLLREDAENSEVLKTLALGYRENDDFENERLTYQHLLKQSPGDLELRSGYIRACLDGGEHQRVADELEVWKEDFLDSDRLPELKAFYEDLREALPDHSKVQRALSLIYEQTGEEDKLPAAAVPAETSLPETLVAAFSDDGTAVAEHQKPLVEVPSFTVSAGAEPAEIEVETAEGAGAAEEIPLGFLEAAAESALPDPNTSAGAEEGVLTTSSPAHGVAEEEIELELELDMPVFSPESSRFTEDSEAEWPDDTQSPGAGAPVGNDVSMVVAEDANNRLTPSEPKASECCDSRMAQTPSQLVAATPHEEILEELEPEEILEELEPEEILEELEPEEVLEGVEPLSGFEPEGEVSSFEFREPIAAVGPGGLTPKDVQGELEEAQFYLQQGLLADAERICRQLLIFDPKCEEAKAKLAAAEDLRRKTVSTPQELELFGLPAEISEAGVGAESETSGEITDEDRFNLDGIFDDFKKGVETQIDVEDTETHFNLGIAYKEMGLLDDAVAEFDKAMRNPQRMIDSLTLKGVCLFEQGAFDLAEEVFKNALAYPGLNKDERVSLNYEMGLLYEAWGRPLEALDSFQSVAGSDLFFRNVGEKVEALRKALGFDVDSGKGDSGAKGDKSRVSYV